MKILLDTHAFIWLMAEPQKLSKRGLEACQDESNMILLSVASIWEILIKHQRGKLEIDLPLEQIVREQTEPGSLCLLPIQAEHVLSLSKLPTHHHDPFDRILMAQALYESAYLLSTDRLIQEYASQVKLFW